MIEWICDGCKKPIADGQGYICCDESTAYERLNAEYAELSERTEFRAMTMRELLDRPGLVHWEVWHRKCDPHPNRADYHFPVEECRTLSQLLDWNTHLMQGKRWTRYTNWPSFIQRHVAPTGLVSRASEIRTRAPRVPDLGYRKPLTTGASS